MALKVKNEQAEVDKTYSLSLHYVDILSVGPESWSVEGSGRSEMSILCSFSLTDGVRG